MDAEEKTIIMVALAFLLLFVGIFDHTLWTPDEPRVAEISREMSVTGDYLIPVLSGSPFLEQPPLYYAAAGIFWKVLGTGNEGFGRLCSVMFAAGTLLVMFFGMRRLYDGYTAALSTLVLSTTQQFFYVSHKMVVDNALCFFIVTALFSSILAYRGLFKRGYVLFWLSLCGAFLTKGVVGIAIPGVAAACFILWQRDFSVIRKAWVIPGTLLVLFTMAAWAYALYVRGGKEFLHTFFLYNNLGRYMGAAGIYTGGHKNPFWYYLPTVLADGLPWIILFIAAMVSYGKVRDDRLRFFYSWFFGGLVLLSLSSTKRGLYLLPLYPALAAVTASWLSVKITEGPQKWETIVMKLLVALMFIASLAAPVAYVKFGGNIPVAAAAFIISAGLLFLAYRTLAGSFPEWLPMGLAILFLVWVTPLYLQIDAHKSYKPFYQKVSGIVGKERVISYNPSETVMAFCPFYGGFSVEPVEDKAQFEQKVLVKEAPFVIDERNKGGLLNLYSSQGVLMLETEGKIRKELKLWRLAGPVK
jgi:4-amino-4-deoxy-L-arabinose transferase-like glycosyltransferase